MGGSQGTPRRFWPAYTGLVAVAVAAFALVVVIVVGLLTTSSRSDAPAVLTAPGSSLPAGTPVNARVPAMPLVDDQGRRTSLAAFRGRWVVLAPSLTLCQEVCPMTSAALTQLQQSLRGTPLAGRVVVAEATVDPWRDSPARLRAYKRTFGAPLTMLTGSQAQIRRLWRFFGVYYHRVAADSPAPLDWWTHRPETMDVEHTNGVALVDPQGRWRAFVGGMPDVGGVLSGRLRALLDAEGRRNLANPQQGWTPAQLLADLWVLGGHRGPAPGTAAGSAGAPVGPSRIVSGGARAFRSRLAALRGTPVVVNEWASWCPPCRHELPLLRAAAAKHAGQVAFVGLNVRDTTGAARSFLSAHPLGYASYADPNGDISRSLATMVGLPTTVFL